MTFSELDAILSIEVNRYKSTDYLISTKTEGRVIMDRHYIPITNTQQLQEAIVRCRKAQAEFATFTQEQVDKIFLAAASAANKARIPLAKMAVS